MAFIYEDTDLSFGEIMADSYIVIGERYKFAYPVEFTTLDDYSAHRGLVVTVIGPCSENEADFIWDDPEGVGKNRIVDRMFKVTAADGWCGDAWESELEPC